MTRKSKYLDNLDSSDSSIPLKERVFLKLNKYPNIKTEDLCKLLNIRYYDYRNTIYSYKSEWKKSKQKDRQRLKALSCHAVRYFGYVLKSVRRELAFKVGWEGTRAKNRMIVWKDRKRFGRIEWFETGRVNCWVRKPASLGKMKQLLANAFFATGLVFDINIFNEWAEGFRLKGFHLVLDTGELLPYAKISCLKDEVGVVAVIGDDSHRMGLELQVVLPDFRERQEQLQQLTLQVLDSNSKQIQQFSVLMKQTIDVLNGNNGQKPTVSGPSEPTYIS